MPYDLKVLLRKYIRHVFDSEGTDFILDCTEHSAVKFTQVEWDILTALAEDEDALRKAELKLLTKAEPSSPSFDALQVGAVYPKMPWLEKYVTGTGQVMLVHAKTASCAERCVIHNPTDPHKDWPTHWRSDTGVMERMCPHGVGHPDRDHLAFVRSKNPSKADMQAVHGCDGCCAVPRYSWEAP